MFTLTGIKAIFRAGRDKKVAEPEVIVEILPAAPAVQPLSHPTVWLIPPTEPPQTWAGPATGKYPVFLTNRPNPWKTSTLPEPAPRPAPPVTSLREKRQGVGRFSDLVGSKTDIEALAKYHEARREELWEKTDTFTPYPNQLKVIAPGAKASGRDEFLFGTSLYSPTKYGWLVKYIREEAELESLEPLVLVSKNYPKAIYDVPSYSAWVEWMKCSSDPMDRMLIAV